MQLHLVAGIRGAQIRITEVMYRSASSPNNKVSGSPSHCSGLKSCAALCLRGNSYLHASLMLRTQIAIGYNSIVTNKLVAHVIRVRRSAYICTIALPILTTIAVVCGYPCQCNANMHKCSFISMDSCSSVWYIPVHT